MSDGLSVPTASQTTIVAPPSNDISILSAKPVVAEDIKSLAPIVNWTQGKMIGQGAFGKVFHALNLDTGEFMAVKQVLLGPSSGANNAASEANKKKQSDALERELDMLKDLEHENIVRYLGFELKDGSLNLFLQYVSGGSIASLLSKTGKLDLIVARYFTFQILCGMAYLHSKNIIHRDIKGGNILVDADGICKISDFGTSKKNAYQMAYQRVTRMSMQGTIPWMAPEVAKGKGYSAKVDIWSVGCMVLEMLTGVPPWHKVSASVIYLLGTGNSPPVPDDLSPIAKDFLKTCFVIDPDKRPTALELVDHEFCRLSSADSESFEFQAWVLAAEERHAAEIGDAMEEEEDSSDYTDSDEDDSDSDEEEEDDETTSHEELESDDHSEIEEAAMSE
ncbi:kinase-like domain-containing protein [Obelidium mucronatum]|nr:kinase-like domain-containing protein [Obelidium mucronatum]